MKLCNSVIHYYLQSFILMHYFFTIINDFLMVCEELDKAISSLFTYSKE